MAFGSSSAPVPNGANASPAQKTQPSSAPYVLPTHFSSEQVEIIKNNKPIVIGQAFAGTGKSTTGLGYAMANPDKRILVLCFNTANAAEAEYKYRSLNSRNIAVGTTHALARQFLTPQLRARTSHRWSPVTLRAELPLVGARADMRTAAITHRILRDFFMTPDAKFDPILHGKLARKELNATDASIEQCCDYAERLWLAMNTEDMPSFMRGTPGSVNPISIPHDAYLKRFVMSEKNLGFDTIIFDEAQDANPITIELLEHQHRCGSKLLVLGDQHQAIYEFRGATNAMRHFEGAPDSVALPLTQSWRFGPKTAEIANMLLGELKGERHKIQGMGQDGWYDKDQHDLAFLARTNACLIEKAASCEGVGVHWVGGVDGYRVDVVQDAWALRCGRVSDIKDAYMRNNFRSWSEFKETAELDSEAGIIYKLIEKYGDYSPELAENLRNNAVPNAEDASLSLATLHKSKGLEFDYVQVGSDFKVSPLEQAEKWLSGESQKFPEQEINLLYVGYTRARKSALFNGDTLKWRDSLNYYRSQRVRAFNPEDSSSYENEVDAPVKERPIAKKRTNPFGRVAPFIAQRP